MYHGYGMSRAANSSLYLGQWLAHEAMGSGALVEKHGLTIVEGTFVSDWTIYKDR